MRRPRLPPALLLLASLPLLTACGSPPPVLVPVKEVVRVTPPAPLLACADEPSPPEGAYSQDDVAEWVVALAYAGRDCRAKLGDVRGWSAEP